LQTNCKATTYFSRVFHFGPMSFNSALILEKNMQLGFNLDLKELNCEKKIIEYQIGNFQKIHY